MNIKIITDSASDITQDEAKKMGITVIPLTTCFDTEEFLDGINITKNEFFEKLVETDVSPTTSQIPPARYEDAFNEIIEEGTKIICITLSSKLSGCFQSASIAADEYEGQIAIVDSENVTVGERLLVEYALKLISEGREFDEIVSMLNEAKSRIKLVALLDTLEYLKRGGRISPIVAKTASVLSIKPVIAVEDGEIALLGKARGSKNGNNLLTEFVEKSGPIDYEMPLSLAYSGIRDDLLKKYLQDNIDRYDIDEDELFVCQIGSAIGTHVGPGAIAFSFFSK